MTTTNFFEFTKYTSTRGHSLSVYKTPYKNNWEKFLFRNRIINLWNKLPQHVANAPNIMSFKKQINGLPLKFFESHTFIR